MEKAKNLKAYIFTDKQTGYDEIEWFETAGQARSFFASEQGLHFCDVRVYRVPWADEYWSKGYVPPEVCFTHGWWFECNQCDKIIEKAYIKIEEAKNRYKRKQMRKINSCH